MPPFVQQILQQHPDAGYWHQQYPWFSIGQLVNAANTKDTPAFTESAQRTAVFFNDIPRLHWLLHQPEVDIDAIKSLLLSPKQLEDNRSTHSLTSTETAVPTDEIILYEKGDSAVAEDTLPDETGINTQADAEPAVSTTEESVISETTDISKPPIAEEILIKPIVTTESKQLGVKDEQDEQDITGEAIQTKTSDTNSTDSASFTEPENAPPPEVLGEEEETTEEPDTENEELLPLPTNMLSESLAQAADNFKNAPSDEEELVFKTAYQHTIDYFASQGIKLDTEPAKDDRFGQQLKTFTSWLRQMKRLPDAPVPEADPLVESHAAHSLQRGEVLTEPMVDVLLKQGKNAQAVAVLEKLRLLHPEKSHYFAARIQQIKHS